MEVTEIPSSHRVFMTGRSEKSVIRRAREKYVNYTVTRVLVDLKKSVPKSARLRGYPRYYRVSPQKEVTVQREVSETKWVSVVPTRSGRSGNIVAELRPPH